MSLFPLQPSTAPSRPVFNQKGFTLIEALVGLGLLTILIATNMTMVASFFSMRDQQLKKHDFYDSLHALSVRLEDRTVCEAVMKSLGPPPFLMTNLATPAEIAEIKMSPSSAPLIRKGDINFDTLKIEKISVSLANGPPYPSNFPISYLWLTLEYHYLGHPAKPNSTQLIGEFTGTKRILYEVGLAPAMISGTMVDGTFVPGSCEDFISKRDKQASQLMCLIFVSKTNNSGKCDLFDNPDIRTETCKMTGYKFENGARYCSTTPL